MEEPMSPYSARSAADRAAVNPAAAAAAAAAATTAAGNASEPPQAETLADGQAVQTPHAAAPPSVPGEPLLARIADFVSGPGLAITWTRRVIALLLGLAIWHVAVATDFNWIINFENGAAPAEAWASLTKQLTGSMFYKHIAVSMERILIAYALAAVIGIALGLIMGRSRIAHDFVMPFVELFRPIPAVAWIPLAILMWPTEESSIIYITFLGALFPIILSTVAGVEQTPEVLVRAAQSLGAKRMQIFRHVVLPAALPSIATGLAVGMGVAWFSLLAGEIISGQYGIGYFTWTAYHLIKYDDIIVGMLTIGLLGTLSTLAVRLLMAPFLRWQRKAR